MITQSNAVPGSPLENRTVTPVVMSATRPLYWSVRREIWENRSIYIAPLAVAGVTLLGFVIATMGRAMSTSNLDQRRAILEEPPSFASLVIMATTFLVAVFYCLDALHGERRDRSILFWKSMPVSDLTTVLSKASIPLVILPLVTFAITIAMQWIMLLLNTIAMMGSGLSVATLWAPLAFFQMSVMLLYHLVVIHGLYYAPIYGWLLLVSAWARRAPFLWASLPLLAIGVVEKLAFNTSHFGAMLASRVSGGGENASFTSDRMSMDPLTQLHPGQFLTSPGLWIGLAVTAVFLAAAVRMRRYREPI